MVRLGAERCELVEPVRTEQHFFAAASSHTGWTVVCFEVCGVLAPSPARDGQPSQSARNS